MPDRLIAFILLILLIVPMIILGLLIIVFDGAPVFFIQDRIGKGRKSFKIYKFRTMKDGDITTIGKLMRVTGLDELPQLINILKGDMAFIGPRPLTQADIVRLNWDAEFYNSRWYVKPGITGMAQLSPRCHKKMSYFLDCYYAKNKSNVLNVKIMFFSVLGIILGRGKVKQLFFGR